MPDGHASQAPVFFELFVFFRGQPRSFGSMAHHRPEYFMNGRRREAQSSRTSIPASRVVGATRAQSPSSSSSMARERGLALSQAAGRSQPAGAAVAFQADIRQGGIAAAGMEQHRQTQAQDQGPVGVVVHQGSLSSPPRLARTRAASRVWSRREKPGMSAFSRM
jgi:hypothetical protein